MLPATGSVPAGLGNMINTEGEELFPYMQDEKTLYFSSDGHPGIGGLDIYYAQWDESRNAFSEPQLLGIPFNSSYDDMSPAFFADGASGFMSSNRPAAKAGDNIYYFNRSTLFLALDIVDENGEAPVAGATVQLQATGDKREMSSGIDGHLLTSLYPQTNYVARIQRDGYEPQELAFLAAGTRPVDTIRRRVVLRPTGGVPYHGIVMDRAGRVPLPYTDVVVKQLGANPHTDTLHSDAGGGVDTRLAEGSDYQIFALKEGMYSEERLVPLKNVRRGTHQPLNDTIFMSRLQVGAVIKIENIYYDYDKANIREDAKPSLERLIDVLKTHPGMAIRINAHTDCRGADAYNQNLSQRRAASVVRWLTENGVGADRMESKGYGESNPVTDCKCSNCTEEQHQENRRTEFEILKM
ncbi:MAG: OmpA family protein [Chitinophagaceae bacterium]